MKRLGQEYAGYSVSCGTLRDYDLLTSCMDFLRSIAEECEIADRVTAIEQDIQALATRLLYAYLDDWSYATTAEDVLEQIRYIINEDIWDLLGEIAPQGCYFGAHPGDGSDFGFWLDTAEC